MPFIPNPSVFPPDGYYFIDADQVKHVGANWPELAANLRNYRIRNGKAVGNPILEINEFTCARFPEGCRETTTVHVARPAPGQPSPASKLSAAVHRWFYMVIRAIGENPVQLVPKDEAQQRAEICAKCPRQASWTTDCGSCAGAASRLALSIRKNQDVKNGDNLMGCSVLQEDTRTSVWLPRLKPSDDPALPANCWRKAK